MKKRIIVATMLALFGAQATTDQLTDAEKLAVFQARAEVLKLNLTILQLMKAFDETRAKVEPAQQAVAKAEVEVLKAHNCDKCTISDTLELVQPK